MLLWALWVSQRRYSSLGAFFDSSIVAKKPVISSFVISFYYGSDSGSANEKSKKLRFWFRLRNNASKKAFGTFVSTGPFCDIGVFCTNVGLFYDLLL
jgi:hypothetical protein